MKQIFITLLLFAIIVFIITGIVSRAFGTLGLEVTQIQVFAVMIIFWFIGSQFKK